MIPSPSMNGKRRSRRGGRNSSVVPSRRHGRRGSPAFLRSPVRTVSRSTSGVRATRHARSKRCSAACHWSVSGSVAAPAGDTSSPMMPCSRRCWVLGAGRWALHAALTEVGGAVRGELAVSAGGDRARHGTRGTAGGGDGAPDRRGDGRGGGCTLCGGSPGCVLPARPRARPACRARSGGDHPRWRMDSQSGQCPWHGGESRRRADGQ